MQQLWLVTVPNQGQQAETSYQAIQSGLAGDDSVRIHRFTIPSLPVSTLDALIALSDDLNKINTQVEVRITKHCQKFSFELF